MGKIAFVFSGQGAQVPGMGKELYDASPAAKAVFDLADSIRPGTSAQCFSGTKEELSVTINTQPCLYCVDLAAAESLREAGIVPDAVAGFSLGEIAALAFSGIFSKQDAFKLVCERARLMQQAAESAPGAMAAVLKLDNKVVEELCQKYKQVYPVNYNCPGQLVVAGEQQELSSFCADVSAAGGRAVPLAVSGGFHSPFMQSASEGLLHFVRSLPVQNPEMPVVSNCTAEPYDGKIEEMIAAQVKSPVLWQKTVENLTAAGFDTFIEVGPGKTLCGLIKKTAAGANIYNVEDAKSLAETIKKVTEGKEC